MDKNLEVIVKDLRVLIMLLFYDDVKGDHSDMRIPVRHYLAANGGIIKKGLDAVRQLEPSEAEELRDRHNLHYSIADDVEEWFDYNYEIINRAIEFQRRDSGDELPYPNYSDSEIEPLMRMLEYAMYVVDTSEFSVEVTPVVKYLPVSVLERRKDQLKPYLPAV